MPKVVDYSSRFAQIREAAYAIALRDGADGISLPRVAEEIGTSVSTVRRLLSSATHLPRLALDWHDFRNRSYLGRSAPGEVPREDPAAADVNPLLRELPYTEGRADDARVFRTVTLGFPSTPWAIEARNGRALLLATLGDRAVPEKLPAEARRLETSRLNALFLGAVEAVCDGVLRPQESVLVVRQHLSERASAWEAPTHSGVA